MEKPVFLFKNVNPYNVIAELISHTKVLNPELFSSGSKRDTTCIPEGCLEDVDEFFSSHPIYKDSKVLIREGISKEEVASLKEWSHYNSFFHVFNLIVKLTNIMDCDSIIASSYVRSFSGAGFTALNENSKETAIIILPRVKTINDSVTPFEEDNMTMNAKKWADERDNGINQDLSNIYYIDIHELSAQDKECLVIHHAILDKTFLSSQESLKIAVSPIISEDVLEFKKYHREEGGQIQRLFSITGLKNKKWLKLKYRQRSFVLLKNMQIFWFFQKCWEMKKS